MKRALLFSTVFIAAMVAMLFSYANWSMQPLPAETKADSVLVLKSERKLILLRNGQRIKEYVIALGDNPTEKKTSEGDGRTPEGRYKIDFRNPKSIAHLSLHISYPDQNDVTQARSNNVSPGGNIMIHGLPNGYGFTGRLHRFFDWTDGCIGVTNPEIEEIWRCVVDGTPIEIRP